MEPFEKFNFLFMGGSEETLGQICWRCQSCVMGSALMNCVTISIN